MSRLSEILKNEDIVLHRQRDIESLAYRKWLKAGKPSDKDMDFWLEAEREYEEQLGKICELQESCFPGY